MLGRQLLSALPGACQPGAQSGKCSQRETQTILPHQEQWDTWQMKSWRSFRAMVPRSAHGHPHLGNKRLHHKHKLSFSASLCSSTSQSPLGSRAGVCRPEHSCASLYPNIRPTKAPPSVSGPLLSVLNVDLFF